MPPLREDSVSSESDNSTSSDEKDESDEDGDRDSVFAENFQNLMRRFQAFSPSEELSSTFVQPAVQPAVQAAVPESNSVEAPVSDRLHTRL